MSHGHAQGGRHEWRLALRLWWGYSWRLALWALAASVGGALIGGLVYRVLGFPIMWGYRAVAYVTMISFFVGQVDCFRRLVLVYDIHAPGGREHEQERRHRR